MRSPRHRLETRVLWTGTMSMLKLAAGAEWVNAPIEMKFAPAAAIS